MWYPVSTRSLRSIVAVVAAVLSCLAAPVGASAETQLVQVRIAAPLGCTRIPAAPGSFGMWLRDLPLRPGCPDIRLYDGREKVNQNAHCAVLDMDVGSRDLQQCADAVIRLRAEYLFSAGCDDDIQFHFTSGDIARWAEWRDGIRPRVSDDRVSWVQTADPDASYSNFRQYLDTVFAYAGSASLSRELVTVPDCVRPEIGDVFIQGGFPGHAVIVIDVAATASGERVFLLAQSYMPAQDIHILRSYDDIDPWYRAQPAGTLKTPEWDFHHQDLKRFEPTQCEREADGTWNHGSGSENSALEGSISGS